MGELQNLEVWAQALIFRNNDPRGPMVLRNISYYFVISQVLVANPADSS